MRRGLLPRLLLAIAVARPDLPGPADAGRARRLVHGRQHRHLPAAGLQPALVRAICCTSRTSSRRCGRSLQVGAGLHPARNPGRHAGGAGAGPLPAPLRDRRCRSTCCCRSPFPLVVSGIGLMLVFGPLGWLGRVWPVGLACCVINLPFMIWAVAAAANHLDPDLELAAHNCGAPPTHAFFTVTLPAVTPGHRHRRAGDVHPRGQRVPGQPDAGRRAHRDAAGPGLQCDPLDHHARPRRRLGRLRRRWRPPRSWLLDRLVGLDMFLKSKQS